MSNVKTLEQRNTLQISVLREQSAGFSWWLTRWLVVEGGWWDVWGSPSLWPFHQSMSAPCQMEQGLPHQWCMTLVSSLPSFHLVWEVLWHMGYLLTLPTNYATSWQRSLSWQEVGNTMDLGQPLSVNSMSFFPFPLSFSWLLIPVLHILTGWIWVTE